MARLRSSASTDLRAYRLERLLYHQAGGWAPPYVDKQIAKVRSGEPFIVRGWEVRLQPSNDDFLIESDGTAVRLETTRVRTGDDECVELRRPDGSLVESWPQPPKVTRQQVAE